MCVFMLCGCSTAKEGTDVKSEDAALRFIPYEELGAQGYGEYKALFD